VTAVSAVEVGAWVLWEHVPQYTLVRLPWAAISGSIVARAAPPGDDGYWVTGSNGASCGETFRWSGSHVRPVLVLAIDLGRDLFPVTHVLSEIAAKAIALEWIADRWAARLAEYKAAQ